MKIFVDLFPLICFFVAYRLSDIYVATAVAIVTTVGLVAWMRLTKRTISPMLWLTLAIVVVFGGLTIYLHDNRFILWKPTVLYWLFSIIILVSMLVFKKNLLRVLMAEARMRMPDAVWNRLAWAWSIFFAAMGAANLYVAFNFSESTWVTFKTFGATGLTVAFVVIQMLFVFRYVEEEKPGEEKP